jgi:hypothetical protein
LKFNCSLSQIDQNVQREDAEGRGAETTAEPLHRDKQVESFEPSPHEIADLSGRM